MTTSGVGVDAKAAITQARNEVAKENLEQGVEALKIKLRELAAAEVVVANVTREIADLLCIDRRTAPGGRVYFDP